VEAAELASVGLLLSLADDGVLGGFADAVLLPLEQADRSGALLHTLATWLELGGSAEETARRLGVHRHTVRNRLDRAEAVTGRSLADPRTRYELWLALQARDRRPSTAEPALPE
jgi:purine catabolism regulator